MKRNNLPIQKWIIVFLVSLSLLGTSLLSKPQSANAAPARIFRPILREIQNQLPRGMRMRLPNFFPNPPRDIPGYRPEIIPDPQSGYFAIMLAISSCPPPAPGACDMGRLYVTRPSNSNASQWLQEAKRKGARINLKNRVVGFYISYTNPTRGLMREIIWEQNGMIFGVMSRSMSQEQVINIAKSMANEPPIRSAR